MYIQQTSLVGRSFCFISHFIVFLLFVVFEYPIYTDIKEDRSYLSSSRLIVCLQTTNHRESLSYNHQEQRLATFHWLGRATIRHLLHSIIGFIMDGLPFTLKLSPGPGGQSPGLYEIGLRFTGFMLPRNSRWVEKPIRGGETLGGKVLSHSIKF